MSSLSVVSLLGVFYFCHDSWGGEVGLEAFQACSKFFNLDKIAISRRSTRNFKDSIQEN